MKEWRCLKSIGIGWTEGKIYKTDIFERLIDDNGLRRLAAEKYNKSFGIIFEEANIKLENE